MKAIIYAQGRGSRWADGRKDCVLLPSDYKQLIPINKGETVLSRTIRQLQEHKVDNIMLVAVPNHFYHLGVPIYTLRDPVGCIIQGILSTVHLWKDEKNVLFILGDVVFSNKTIHSIANNHAIGTSFFGRKGANVVTGKSAKEIFAVTIQGTREMIEEFRRACSQTLRDTAEPDKLKLWDLFHLMELREVSFQFVDNFDYTDDFDSPESYFQFWDIMRKEIIKDDKQGYKSYSNILPPHVSRREKSNDV